MHILRTPLALALLASLGFGAYPVLLRAAFESGVSPSGALLLATWGRLVMLLTLSWKSRARFWSGTRRDRGILALGGVCETALTCGVFYSLGHLPAAIVSTAMAAGALPVAVWELVRGVRRPTLALGIAIGGGLIGVIATTGVLDVAAPGTSSGLLAWIALALAVAGIIGSSAIAAYRLRTHTAAHTGAECFMMVAALVTLGLGWNAEFAGLAGIGGAWLAAGIAVLGAATLVSYHGMGASGVLEWRVLTTLQPVAALAVGALVGVDRLTSGQGIGVIIVVVAIGFFQRDQPEEIAPTPVWPQKIGASG